MEFDVLPACSQKWIHNLIFLRIPKTASSSVISCLGDRNLIWKHRGLFAQKLQKLPIYKGVFDTTHAAPDEIYSILSSQVFDYFSFAVKREPFSRLESAFSFGKMKRLAVVYGLSEDLTLNEFVNFLFESWQDKRRDILILRPQTDWIFGQPFQPKEVLKFEQLSKDWKKMLLKHSISGLANLPHENKSEKTDVLWTAEARKRVFQIYEKDFDLLGYSPQY